MKAVLLLAALAPLAGAASDPLLSAWILARPSSAPAAIQPEVQAVSAGADWVEVRSAGLSLIYLGPFANPPAASNEIRHFTFRIPRHPEPAGGNHPSAPPGNAGVFVNGIPVYNLFEAASYNGQNLWHFDPIAAAERAQHGNSLGVLANLIADGTRHSPILGFAADGYPIYGPWGFANADGSGGLHRMRSSYRLCKISHRIAWPDGTVLTPAQYGPDPGADFPLGAFAEDYEYAAGSGDLDEFNGRFTVTPEYPNGTYAYFLSTDSAGRLAFPYLLAGRLYGKLADESPKASTCAGAICFSAEPQSPEAGQAVRLSFQIRDAAGRPVRFLEYVHEKPIHLVVVSSDLQEFAHIHPEPVAGDRFEVVHTFPHAGQYRLYAEFTAPGAATEYKAFDLDVSGSQSPAASAAKSSAGAGRIGSRGRSLTVAVPCAWNRTDSRGQGPGPLCIDLHTEKPLRAGEDIELRFSIGATDLEPYLGAWAHVVIIDDRLRHFIHAHPMDDVPQTAAGGAHVHALPIGASPPEIRVPTSFPGAGTYKIWFQVQRRGEVIATPFVVQVAAAQKAAAPQAAIPKGAVRIRVGGSGFDPARIDVPAGKPITLAFIRSTEPNCASKIAMPELNIVRDLPLGGTTIIDLPAMPARELRFACGMGMFKGILVLR